MNVPSWSEIPTSEGWWFDDESQSWEDVASADLATAIVEDWRGLWFGPIIIPEPPAPLRRLPDPEEFLPGAHGPGF